jgi:hypothetical protein
MAVDGGEPADPLFRDAVGGGEECADDGSTVAVVAAGHGHGIGGDGKQDVSHPR